MKYRSQKSENTSKVCLGVPKQTDHGTHRKNARSSDGILITFRMQEESFAAVMAAMASL